MPRNSVAKVPRQRRDHQNARLRRIDVLGEMQRDVPKGRSSATSSTTGTSRLPTLTVADGEIRPNMGDLEAGDHFHRRGHLAAEIGGRPPQGCAGQRLHTARHQAERRDKIVFELVGLIEHLPAVDVHCKKASAICAALREDCRGRFCRPASGQGNGAGNSDDFLEELFLMVAARLAALPHGRTAVRREAGRHRRGPAPGTAAAQPVGAGSAG